MNETITFSRMNVMVSRGQMTVCEPYLCTCSAASLRNAGTSLHVVNVHLLFKVELEQLANEVPHREGDHDWERHLLAWQLDVHVLCENLVK